MSKYVLSDFFDEVDLVDQNEDYVDAAADYIGSSKMKRYDHVLSIAFTKVGFKISNLRRAMTAFGFSGC